MTTNRLGRAIGAAALILAAGNLTGSVFGFIRQTVITTVFGQNTATDAFFAASVVPQMFFDLTIGAAVSAALIPSLAEALQIDGEAAFRRLLGNVLALAWVVLAVVVVLLVLAAGPLMSLILSSGYAGRSRHDVSLAVSIARILIPSLFFLGTSAVLLSALYALRRFRVSAFAGSFYHIGIIAAAIILARPLGILALPVGAVAGAAAQALIQVPALIVAGQFPRPRLALTPAVRRVIRLYLPVAAGLIVTIIGQIIDTNLKWRLSSGSLSAMTQATTLTQFPIGIVVAALSFAVLPSISADVASSRIDDFKATLATGLRFSLFLTIPAALGYIALATPIVSLVFQHGKFTGVDTGRTALALAGYSIQIPFVGVDQLLIFAFYARKNTVTPMLVGVLGVLIYLGSALLLMPRYQILGLALANTIQNSTHAVILGILLVLSIGSLRGYGVLATAAKALAAGGIMAAGAWACAAALRSVVNPHLLAGQAALVIVPMLIAVTLYVGISALARSSELSFALSLVRR